MDDIIKNGLLEYQADVTYTHTYTRTRTHTHPKRYSPRITVVLPQPQLCGFILQSNGSAKVEIREYSFQFVQLLVQFPFLRFRYVRFHATMGCDSNSSNTIVNSIAAYNYLQHLTSHSENELNHYHRLSVDMMLRDR